MALSIGAALRSGCFSEVMVSTDSEEIADVARRYGASVPFMRSAKASDDFATTADVLLEVLDEYERRGRKFDAVACIYATAPFIRTYRLRQAVEMLEQEDCEGAFTCVQYSYPVQRGLEVDEAGLVKMRFPQYAQARSQDLAPTYHDAGQFYLCTVESLRRDRSLWGKATRPIILPELEVQDLDTPVDWKLAEMKFRLLKFPHVFPECDENIMILNYVGATRKMHHELLDYRNDADIRSRMVNDQPISWDSHIRFVNSLTSNPDKAYYVVLVSKGDGNPMPDVEDMEVAGSINFEWVAPGVVERGIWIAPKYQGKGLATRILRNSYGWLADNLCVKRIVTKVKSDNEASKALENALGAKLEADDCGYCHYGLDL